MAYSEIYAILNTDSNNLNYVSVGLLKRVLQELLMAFPASPAPLDTQSKIQGG